MKDKTLKAVFNELEKTKEGRQRIVDAYWKTVRQQVEKIKGVENE